ncbi:MAG: TetR/AcrR family transcriptional regulator [Rhizobiaceae bacterium]
MTVRNEDRRVERTRSALYCAFQSLVLERGYDAVTVQDILDCANVGRSAFYSHFKGKEALLRSGFEALQHQLQAADESTVETPFAFSLPLFRQAQAHAALYRAMLAGRGELLARREFRRILDLWIDRDLGPPASARPGRGYAVSLISGAFLGVLEHWLSGNRTAPAEELDAIFRRLLSDGASPWLRR